MFCRQQVPHGAACDGFYVSAHAYLRLWTYLKHVQCDHLTAVLLGTEHNGSTPIALSCVVKVTCTFTCPTASHHRFPPPFKQCSAVGWVSV
jgi:hypothetical protein